MKPTISVICPIYQAENYLKRCVDSILEQTFHDFELLLIDDGSRDRSGEICDEYARADHRVRVFHKENGGVCSARNFGLDNALGEYSIHVDPDDWVEPTMLEELYAKAVADNADMVICDFFINWEKKQIYSSQSPSSLDHQIVLRELFNKLHASCWNKLVKCECFRKYGIRFPENLSIWEDTFVNASLCMENISIAYLDKAFYHYDYYTNPNSLVRSNSQKCVESQKWIVSYFESRVDDKSILDSAKIATKERAFYSLIGNGSQIKDLYPEVNETYLGLRNYANPLWRWLALTIKYPSLLPVTHGLLVIEESVRLSVAKLVRLIKK